MPGQVLARSIAPREENRHFFQIRLVCCTGFRIRCILFREFARSALDKPQETTRLFWRCHFGAKKQETKTDGIRYARKGHSRRGKNQSIGQVVGLLPRGVESQSFWKLFGDPGGTLQCQVQLILAFLGPGWLDVMEPLDPRDLTREAQIDPCSHIEHALQLQHVGPRVPETVDLIIDLFQGSRIDPLEPAGDESENSIRGELGVPHQQKGEGDRLESSFLHQVSAISHHILIFVLASTVVEPKNQILIISVVVSFQLKVIFEKEIECGCDVWPVGATNLIVVNENVATTWRNTLIHDTKEIAYWPRCQNSILWGMPKRGIGHCGFEVDREEQCSHRWWCRWWMWFHFESKSIAACCFAFVCGRGSAVVVRSPFEPWPFWETRVSEPKTCQTDSRLN